MILPYAPGGSGDLVFRTLQQGLEKRIGQSMVLEFRTGGAGLIGVREVVKAPADGYTLLLGPTNNFVIDQHLHKALGYEPLAALAPVTVLADTPYLLVINAVTPAATYAEFASYARANRGRLNYASPGPATVPHLAGHMLDEVLGAQMTHVAFRGNAQAIVALLGGEVQMIVHSYGSIAPLFAAGKLRALAVGAPRRLDALPAVPTSAEAGVPDGIILGNWWALAAPRGTDGAIVERLSREVRATLADPAVRKRYEEQGWIAGGGLPQETAERLRREAAAWKSVVDRSGVKVE